MNRILLSLFSISLFSCQLLAQGTPLPDQVEILSKLTGHSPIKTDVVLHDRFAQESRLMAAEFLKEKLTEFSDKAEIENYSETGNNVVGTILATSETDEWIVLGAHYDSVKDCPGANDNGTGVALVYSVAKHIASLPQRKYNMKIVFFDEEERGLVGSKAYAQKLLDEQYKVVEVHTADQMGWDADEDRAFELEMPTEEIKAHYLKVAEEMNYAFPIEFSTVTSTDHRSFRKAGFNAVGLTEEYVHKDTTPYYHKPTDTFETVNFQYLGTVTGFVQKVFEDLLKP